MKKGFTLIEMMIVVAIIAIIAAIAIPSLLAARRASLETNAVSSLQAYATAQSMFKRGDWDGDSILTYAPNFPALCNTLDGKGDPLRLIDGAFANAIGGGPAKHGYNFADMASIGGTPIDWEVDFGLCGLPKTYGRTGYRTFIIATEGTVFSKDNGPGSAFVADYPANPATAGWLIAE